MQYRRAIQGLLTQIHTFECAARHGSFTKAATELGVSQPAVSLAVRQLERHLGQSLFMRKHRSIELNHEGRELYLEARNSLDNLERVVTKMDKRQVGQHVTLSCSTAFANHWFVPRLSQFQADHPDIDLRLQTTDRDLDLGVENADLAVRRGDGTWPGYAAQRLAADVLFPVASPAYVATGDWQTERLIHLDEPNRPRPGWNDFFVALSKPKVSMQSGLRLNDYALALQATMAGEGIALGWQHIVETPLQQGLLIRVGVETWRTQLQHDLIWSQQSNLRPQAALVRDWVLAAGPYS